MKNLFQPEAYQEIITRLDRLTPESQRQWGKMDVAQMMAHCSAAFEVALGDRYLKRGLIGVVFGRWAKKKYVYSTKYNHNDPTDPTFKIVNQCDFMTEKVRLKEFIDRFYHGKDSVVTKGPHSFFGKMTPVEWAQLKYNHLNHHFSQFGV